MAYQIKFFLFEKEDETPSLYIKRCTQSFSQHPKFLHLPSSMESPYFTSRTIHSVFHPFSTHSGRRKSADSKRLAS
ncbi:hypothetical protein BRADI_3g05573v3 [Brachypodium distachyon]|uniref:Uncharacterized protein n=1 Tax=Brachypodium distachyon TaxID=15368 RepID=A0A0Q3F2A2_BRADI|nr:hypothetical protein BRADI_3g05573v3 [Brachypodium distachyon]